MKARVATIFIVWSVCATSVEAQVDQCLELVRLSRMSSRTIMSQSQFASTLNAYCDEREQVDARSGSVGVSGFGSATAARTTASYAKFCSRDTVDRGSESDYQEYMEGVQPGAYAAFAACIAARDNDGVQFEMSGKPTRERLVLGIFNQTNIGATADMQWSGSAPVTCQWTGEELGAPRRRLQPDERAFLECRRSSFNQPPLQEADAVDVFRSDGGDAPVLTIPWPKYGPDDMPVPALVDIRRAMERELYALRAELQEVRIQTGIVNLPMVGPGARPAAAQRGGDTLRGIVGERVNFAVFFARVPEVHIAFSSLNTWNGGQNTRASVRVQSIDREGFEYELYSWSNTHLHSASASWVAFVP